MNVQWTSPVVSAVAVLLFCVIAPREVSFTRTDAFLLLSGVVMLCYVRIGPSTESPEALLRACGTMLLAFPTYYAVKTFYRYMSPRLFVFVVGFYLAVLILELVSFSIYQAIFSHFLSEIRRDVEFGRGPNGLCNEASMMGDMSVLFAIAPYFFFPEYWKTHRRLLVLVVGASVLMLIISGSATGIVLGAAVALTAAAVSPLKKKYKMIGLAVLIAVAIAIGGIVKEGESRGSMFIAAVSENPMIVLEDPSFAERFLGIFIDVYSFPKAPFGTGEAILDISLASRAWGSTLMSTIWPDQILRDYVWSVRMTKDTGASISDTLLRMGISGYLILVGVFGLIRGFRGRNVVRLFLAALLLNASFFISTFWFVIGCSVAMWEGSKVKGDAADAVNTTRR
jgi:hypothetical protein